MKREEFEIYIKDRYQDQIEWYSDKSSINKKYYYVFQWIIVIFSTIVPIFVSIKSFIIEPDYENSYSSFEIITLTLTLIVAISTSSLKIFKFQENWINYRTISESLKKEKHYYDAEIYDYQDTEDKEAMFVLRVERLISMENDKWININTEEKKDTNK